MNEAKNPNAGGKGAERTAAAPKPADGETSSVQRPQLRVRLATLADVDALVELSRAVYAPLPAHTAQMLRGQINNFPGGQFVAEYDGRIVGHCATFIISGEIALQPHTWHGITGNGFASRHDPQGDWLYGMEVSVHPQYRRLRIGQRLYNARRQLCQNLGLKGVVFGGRMPGLARRITAAGTADAYLQQACERKVRDPVVSFHLAQGFEPIGVLSGYEPGDRQSLGYASHMVWHNPRFSGEEAAARAVGGLMPQRTVRVATVQYQMRGISSVEEFKRQVEYFVDVASDYRSDFVVFPELLTLQLLSLEAKALPPAEAILRISEYTDWFVKEMRELAVSYNVNIVGGSHPTRMDNGDIRNICYVFLRDGAVHAQHKIHATPSEAYWWNIKGGDSVDVINTDCGPVGVMICYDAEFPEIARQLVDQGAMILFVPFCTDERRGFLRVRYCSHARAVENQCYVVLSGVVGNLPNVENMDIHYAESSILTPCDFPFARDGVAADTAPNTETIAFADLRLGDLAEARVSGSVRNLKDRRHDLYQVNWRPKPSGA